MDPARRESLSTKGKQRWADAKEIAPLLEMTVEMVHNSHARIRHLLDRIKGGEVDAIEEAKKIIKEKRSPIKLHKEFNKNDPLETPEDELRVAMWFIRKIGNPDRALEVMKIAVQASNKLSESK